MKKEILSSLIAVALVVIVLFLVVAPVLAAIMLTAMFRQYGFLLVVLFSFITWPIALKILEDL